MNSISHQMGVKIRFSDLKERVSVKLITEGRRNRKLSIKIQIIHYNISYLMYIILYYNTV